MCGRTGQGAPKLALLLVRHAASHLTCRPPTAPHRSHIVALLGAFSNSQKYWDMRNGRPWHYVSALMVEAAFKRSEHWAGVAAELAQPFDRAAADTRALATDK